jgi:hypothetical protein
MEREYSIGTFEIIAKINKINRLKKFEWINSSNTKANYESVKLEIRNQDSTYKIRESLFILNENKSIDEYISCYSLENIRGGNFLKSSKIVDSISIKI